MDKMTFERKLIHLVSKHSCLYDMRTILYRNKLEKNKKWKIICGILRADESKCRMKWRHLRDQYFREFRKIQETAANGKTRTPKWKYYNIMGFLAGTTDGNIKPDYSMTFDDEAKLSSESDIYHNDFILTEQTSSSRASKEECERRHLLTLTNATTSPLRSIKEDDNNGSVGSERAASSGDEEIFQDVLNEFKQLRTDLNDDHIDIFFRSVAAQTKRLNLDTFQFLDLQVEIIKLIKVTALQSLRT